MKVRKSEEDFLTTNSEELMVPSLQLTRQPRLSWPTRPRGWTQICMDMEGLLPSKEQGGRRKEEEKMRKRERKREKKRKRVKKREKR